MVNSPRDKAPLLDHLEELRVRLIRCGIAVAVAFCLCYAVKEPIFEVLMRPLIAALPEEHSRSLIYTSPHEAFLVYLKVAFLAALFVASPVVIFEVWRFVAPGLYEHEKRFFFPVVLVSLLFFLGGVAFGYWVALPFGFQFFTSFASVHIAPLISTREFFSFVVKLLFAFGLIFELPVVMFFLARLGIVHSTSLRHYRKYAVLVIFIVAAVLTPPDAFSQLMMAIPLLILYELSVFVVHLSERKKSDRDEVVTGKETE